MPQQLPSGGREFEETKRIARILEIVQMIAVAPQRYRRQDLANRFEVSERMIGKDLEVIRHGLKLSLARSRSGYFFEETPNMPAVQYTFAEALALLLTLQAARQMTGVSSAELASATARIEALFPIEFRPILRQMAVPLPMTAKREHRQQMLKLLNLALLQRRKLDIVYQTGSRGGAISERVIHPYHIMPYVRSWQLIAYCERRQDILMFKVDRIHKATMLDENYKVSEDFDANEYIGNVWGVMRGDATEPEDIVLCFTPDAGRWVAEEYWHSSQKVEVRDDGSVIFRLHIGITPEFVNWLLYYGNRVEVLEPDHLRKKVVEEHRDAAALYAKERNM
ncbi:MAG: WYL domain-containing protein [Nitrospirae bacterium]|nr:MAG: WYL domain-containing protein [Nitrospirota bacterium]